MQLIYHQKATSVFEFFRKNREKEIVVELVINNESGFKILEGKAKIHLSKTIKLLSINKTNNSIAEIHFGAENIDKNIEEIIKQKLKHE